MQKAFAEGYRLSPQQKRVWLLQEENSLPYRAYIALNVTGNLDAAVLKSAVDAVVERTELLRTSYCLIPEMRTAVQLIGSSNTYWAEPVSLRELSEQDRQVKLDDLIDEAARAPFELERACVLYARLIDLAESQSVLILSLHALCADAIGIKNLAREIGAAYEALLNGEPLDSEIGQYADFSEALNELLESEETRAGREYWRKQGITVTTNSKLPYENKRNEENGFDPGFIAVDLDALVLNSADALLRRYSVSMSALLLACWQVLLFRATSDAELVIGVSYDGRSYEGLDEAIGLFAKYLPVSSPLNSEKKFIELLEEVHKQTCERREWQDYFSWEKCMNISAAQPAQSFFHFGYDYDEQPNEFHAGGASFSIEKQYVCIDRFKLRLSCIKSLRGLSAEFHFDLSLFNPDDIYRFTSRFHKLLLAVINNPDLLIGKFDILPDDERHLLINGFNQTSRDYSTDTCIHHLFEQQAARAPHLLAVCFRQDHLTYQQLDEKANQLAHHLISLSVGPESLVAICMHRSLELVTALLAILKAGAAYLPLDPAYPPARLSYMVEDSAVKLIVTDRGLANAEQYRGVTVVDVTAEQEQISRQSVEGVVSGVTADNLAYVIYTSGSTGKPKGVMISHRAIANRLLWMQQTYPIGPADSLLQKTSMSFDASVWEIFLPLMSGARLVMAEPGGQQDSRYLVETIRREGITILQMVPTMLEVMAAEADIGECRSLRRVYSGGEALKQEVWRKIKEATGAEVVNLYGPTECAIDATSWEAREGVESRIAPIGKPIGKARVYILDGEQRVAPVGVVGEIYIGGEGVGRGYMRRGDLTAERYIPDEYSGKAGARMYRTGDLGRQTEGGEIEYKGRVDKQVKVRGYRIELREIEAEMEEMEEVKRAVVVVREGEGGQRRLVGYVEKKEGRKVREEEMRRRLEERMPEWMVPWRIVEVEEMPVQPNGKVDTNALPSPESLKSDSEDAYIAPRTEIEFALAQIWQEVLGAKRVGALDNFFELGGDSIISLQVAARARKSGMALNPRLIFQHQTIAELALFVITTADNESGDQSLVVGPVPLTPIQSYYFDQNQPDPHHFNQSVLLEVNQPLKLDLLERVVKALLAHHDALRMSFFLSDDGWQQFNTADSDQHCVSVIDLSQQDPLHHSRTITEACSEAQTSLNLQDGPLIRVVLFDAGAERAGRLLIVIHHLVVDGVSWRVLLEDLESGYRQAEQGGEIEFPAKTTSYKRWAEQMVEYAGSSKIEEEMEHWREVDAAEVGSIPVDKAGKDDTVAGARSVRERLGKEETRRLLGEVPASYRATINEVMVSALARVISRWSEASRVKIEMEGHGRQEIGEGVDVSRTVGWFTSVYPVVVEMGGARTAGERVNRVKREMRKIEAGGIGYGVMKYLRGERLAESKPVDVSFNYFGQFDQVVGGRGMFKVAEEWVGAVVSKKQRRRNLIEINSAVRGAELEVMISYSEGKHEEETIREVARSYIRELEEVISASGKVEEREYSVEDFPLAKVGEEGLRRVIGGEEEEIEDIYPLSPMQQGLLFHSVFEEGSGVYVQQLSCAFVDEIDLDAFERAWRKVIDRHPILRTRFAWQDIDVPLQVVERNQKLPMEIYNWRDLPEDEQRARLSSFIDEDRRRKFDFTKAPMMRCALIYLTDSIQFIWSHHHIILDGWCVPIVIKEVLAYYESYRRRENLTLEPLRPYRSYIEWLEHQDAEKAERYWRKSLEGFVRPTPLNIGPRSAERNGSEPGYKESRIKLTLDDTSALQSLARKHQLTLNTLTQGAWALLLSHYSEHDDIVFGATVAGRPIELEDADSMIGLFINTLPLRVRLSPDANAMTWLRQLQADLTELRQFEYTPLFQVQRWSQIPRGVPAFESHIVFENYPVDEALREWRNKPRINDLKLSAAVHYPLCLMVVPAARLSIAAMYHAGRFDSKSIQAMLDLFEAALLGFIARPDARLEDLKDALKQVAKQQRLSAAKESAKIARQKLKSRLSARPYSSD